MKKLSDVRVSVLVITYNSSRYIVETLESIRRQTYKNIDLIISDDCSRDDTVEICRQWLLENEDEFVETAVITSLKNTGVSANCNRGVRRAKGEWIKLVAGDDILLESCIRDYVGFIDSNRDACFVSAGIVPFDESGDGDPIFASYKIRKKTASLQLDAMLRDNALLPAPGIFLKKHMLDDIGGFDERYVMYEDVPLYVMASSRGYKFYFLDKPVVRYRNHQASIVNSSDLRHSDEVLLHGRDVVLPLLKRSRKYFLYWHIKVMNYSIEKTKDNFVLIDNIILRNIFWLMVDPLYWIVFFVKVRGVLLGKNKKISG
jgi:alpha-1,3-rhamnosyltransferase